MPFSGRYGQAQVNDLLAVLFTDNYYFENGKYFEGNDKAICKLMRRHKKGCNTHWTWPLRKDLQHTKRLWPAG